MIPPPASRFAVRAAWSCLLCSHVAAVVQGPTAQTMTAAPDDAQAVVRRRCPRPNCNGRLMLGEPEVVRIFRRLSPAELDEAVVRGRPPKHCRVCRVLPPAEDRRLCAQCIAARQELGVAR